LKSFKNDLRFPDDNVVFNVFNVVAVVVVVVVLDVCKSLRQDQEDEVHRFGVEVRAEQIVCHWLITGEKKKLNF
jgi:hypothetical protein